jgi:hypothetical protein
MPITNILDEETRKKIVTDNWKIRRRWMKWSLVWMGANIEVLIAWIIVAGGNALGVQIIMTFIGAMIAILMFYIFGATWDDHSKRTLGASPADEKPAEDR